MGGEKATKRNDIVAETGKTKRGNQANAEGQQTTPD